MKIVNPTLSSLLVWVFEFNKSGHELTDMADDVIVSQRSKNLQISTREKWKIGNMATPRDDDRLGDHHSDLPHAVRDPVALRDQ